MTVAHPIQTAWLTTGGTGAQNYDEFADEAEITAIIAANPLSALAVEMPHKAPANAGKTFLESLPDAAARLEQAKEEGAYQRAEDVVVLYRITGSDYDGDDSETSGLRPATRDSSPSVAYGLWCMVDTDQISTSADEPGLVIRNEDVFLEKVRERVALAEELGHLLSPVLLLQTGRGEQLHGVLAQACASAGAAAASDVDAAGRLHEIWPVPFEQAGPLLELAGGGELVVADGNHRSLAAQTGGFKRFLAVVTTPASVTIQPYNRLVHDLGMPVDDFVASFESGDDARLYVRGREFGVRLPRDPDASIVDNLDHALVERQLFGAVLGMDPGDKRITYVGGDYPASWLMEQVDAGKAELAVLIAPVTVDEFVEVNLARQRMPRKSTWFTPKARAGLVVAQLT